MNVKIKKLVPEAVVPTYAKPGDAGMDLHAVAYRMDEEKGYYEFDTGLSIEIPDGYVGLIFPRSSISNTFYSLTNCVGVIDSGYRGPLKFRFEDNSRSMVGIIGKVLFKQGIINDPGKGFDLKAFAPGDRIGQIIILPYPQITFIESDKLSESGRGEDGFGSTGG